MLPPARLPDLLPHLFTLRSLGPAPGHQAVPGLPQAAVAPAALACLDSMGLLAKAAPERCLRRQELVVPPSQGLSFTHQPFRFAWTVSALAADVAADPPRRAVRLGLRDTSGAMPLDTKVRLVSQKMSFCAESQGLSAAAWAHSSAI